MYNQNDFYYTFGNQSEPVTFTQTIVDPVTHSKVHVVGFGASGENANRFAILMQNAQPVRVQDLKK